MQAAVMKMRGYGSPEGSRRSGWEGPRLPARLPTWPPRQLQGFMQEGAEQSDTRGERTDSTSVQASWLQCGERVEDAPPI